MLGQSGFGVKKCSSFKFKYFLILFRKCFWFKFESPNFLDLKKFESISGNLRLECFSPPPFLHPHLCFRQSKGNVASLLVNALTPSLLPDSGPKFFGRHYKAILGDFEGIRWWSSGWSSVAESFQTSENLFFIFCYSLNWLKWNTSFDFRFQWNSLFDFTSATSSYHIFIFILHPANTFTARKCDSSSKPEARWNFKLKLKSQVFQKLSLAYWALFSYHCLPKPVCIWHAFGLDLRTNNL